MRTVRTAQPSGHGFVITIVAFLLLTASAMLGAPHPRATVLKAAEPVRNEYLIMLNVPSDEVPKVARELTKRYGGEVLAVWQHAVKGFWLKAEPEVARRIAQDRRIKSCEENAVAHDSAEPQPTNLNADGTRVKPSPDGEYPALGPPDHPLWHLNRISHRQRQEDASAPDFKYTYGSDGSGIAIYVIDGGVFRWHQEFYPKDTSQAAITLDADNMDKEATRLRVRSDDVAANVTGTNPSALIDDDPVKRDTGNNGDPIAPRDCSAITPSDAPNPPKPHPYNFTDASATHGTACASAAAGRNVGVAKGATIVPVKAMTCNTLSLGAVISALNWTLQSVKSHDAGRAVVSMSLVMSALPDRALVKDGTTILSDAPPAVGQRLDILNAAITALTNYGVPVVVSANNQNKTACETAPANLSIRAGGHVITVGGLARSLDKRWVAANATAGDGKINPGSNFGRCVDIWAPAEGIEVATLGPETSSDHGIAYRQSIAASGTSFSAPIVAGMIARLMSENSSLRGTDATAVQKIYDLLISSATRIPDGAVTTAFGEGSPNRIAYIGGLQITTQPASFQFTGTASETHDLTVTVLTQTDTNPSYQWYSGSAGDTSQPVTSNGTGATLHLTREHDLNSSHWVKVTGRCYDGVGECSAESIAATAFPSDTTACPIEVQVDAAVLTRVIESAPVESEPGMPVQQFDRTGVDIVAHAYGPGPLQYQVSIGGTTIEGGDATEETAQSVDPARRLPWVARVHVAPTADSVYTVKFMRGTVCVGSTNVSVSVCNQPAIKRNAAKFIWRDGVLLGPAPFAAMLDPIATHPTAPSEAMFQWFTGPYDHPVVVSPNFGAKASGTTQILNPLFYPLNDGQYWARIDTRCGWAVSAHINVVSCFPYNPDYLRIVAPTGQVRGDRPVFLSSKMITPVGLTNAQKFEWTRDPGPNHANEIISTQPIVMVKPPPGTSTTYQLKVTNAGGECGSDTTKTVTLTASSCPILVSGNIIRTVDSLGTKLDVVLDSNIHDAGYEWFNMDPASWTWGANNKPVALSNDATFRIPKGAATQRYFVRVTATCGGVLTSEDSNPLDLGRIRAVKPMHINSVLRTYHEFAGSDPVVLSVPELQSNATYNWYSSDTGNVPLGTGPDLAVSRSDVEASVNHTRTYWATTTDSAGNTEDSVIGELVAVPNVSVVAYPGTVIGTESPVALTAKPPGTTDGTTYPAGTTYEWRQATESGDTFVKDLNSPVLNSNPSDNTVWRGPIVDRAAYWVHVVTPDAPHDHESELVLIVVHCDAPPYLNIVSTPVDRHVPNGTTVTLFAVGGGRNLIYQWYRGAQGNTADHIGSGGGSVMVPSAEGSYWVHATDDCGRTADAATTVYRCTPTIPNNVSPPDIWIKSGTSTQLSVNATPPNPGDELHYQWYAGNINLPIAGKTDRTLNVYDTGSFLATVSSACGDGGQSGVQSALMTVRVCTAPVLGLSPASHDTRAGTTEVLHVNSSGDAPTYQWYRGVKDDVSNPIPEQGTTSTISVQPAVDSDYWVRVADHGACSSDSAVIHLTVCAPPAITTQPASSTVFSGQTVTLTVAATPLTAAPLHYTWFEVAADGSQNAVSINGSPSFTTPAITAARTWFVRIYSGDQLMTYTDSQTATVQVCSMPAVSWATPARPLRAGEIFMLQIYSPPAGSKMYWYRGVSGDVAHSTLISDLVDAISMQVVPDAPSSSYWVRVQKDSCYADAPTLTLNVCAPSITQQPAATTINSGGSAVLSVAANTSPLTYQWYKGASGDVSQPISGATNANYTASPTADTLYWARVTGSCGVAADSNAAQVSVCYSPAIVSTGPVSQWLALGGGSTTVSVNATGSNLTYQWYFGNSGDTAAPIVATTSSLTVTPQSTTSYWVRVSGSCGSPQNSVSMVVNICGAPTITTQPQGSTINSGATATMSVTASVGTSTPMTYQWYRGASGDTSTPVGNGLTTFTTPALTATTNYWVRVSCGACNPANSQTATVSVCNNAQPLAGPADQFISIGQSATLSTPPTTGNVYQWYIGASGITSQPAPGTANQSTYAASPSVTTQYWVQIQNGGCTFRTSSATVNVCVPTITQQPASIMINPGASTTLSVAANTSGLTYQWYVGNSGTTTSPISGATASSVTVSPSTATNYWVRVTGSCIQNVNSATAAVTICAPPAIIGTSQTQSIVRNNGTSCFVTATGTNLTYQWYVGASGDTTTPISGATGSSVSVAPQNTTSYWARVTGTCGTVNSVTMLVNVCASPSITAQPQGSVIFSGGTATMSVSASEATTAPVTYQWYRGNAGDTSAPVGTNSTSFTTPALTAQTSYWVRVSCGVCNPADSQTATISICYYPQALPSPGDFYDTAGQTVRLYTSNVAGNTYQWYTGATGDTSHLIRPRIRPTCTTPTSRRR
jgi:hypothetical protein